MPIATGGDNGHFCRFAVQVLVTIAAADIGVADSSVEYIVSGEFGRFW